MLIKHRGSINILGCVWMDNGEVFEFLWFDCFPPPKKKINVLNANEDVHWLLKLKQSNITRDAEYGVSGFSMENNCNHTHP